MTPISAAAAVPVQTTLASVPQSSAPTGQFSSADVEHLRSLVNATPQRSNVSESTSANTVTTTDKSSFRTLGDSMLEGIATFNTGYNDSLSSINAKLEDIARKDVLGIGNNFGDIMALQVEVARWSMSVMGVDNASKAGTNTVKELSKGG